MSRTAVHGDVFGYSRLIADNEIETINGLRVFTSIIEAVVAVHSGEMGDMVGDEFLAVFPSASDAVHAALEMQRLMAEDNQSLPTGRRMQFRLGLHSGVISGEAGRWYGDVVNIGARLQALADPGGVMVSAIVLNASSDVEVRVEAAGQQHLQNIPEPVLAYRLIDDDLSVEDDRPWRRRVSTSEIPSLAVSPFVNLGEPDEAHFAAGLMMSLIVSLMRIPGLDVVSENSTLRYSDTAHSAEQVGHEVGARFVLEGAVQRIGERVRVMAQVIDVEAKMTVGARSSMRGSRICSLLRMIWLKPSSVPSTSIWRAESATGYIEISLTRQPSKSCTRGGKTSFRGQPNRLEKLVTSSRK